MKKVYGELGLKTGGVCRLAKTIGRTRNTHKAVV